MPVYKVEICGVNTSKLPLLSNEEKEELMEIVQIILRKTEKREKEIIKSSPSKDTNETASSF